MSYNISATRRHRQFKYQVVPRIAQAGAPKEKDLLQMTGGEEIIQESLSLLRSPMKEVLGAQKHSSIFGENRHRNSRLKARVRQKR
jgi:hypothetical protein